MKRLLMLEPLSYYEEFGLLGGLASGFKLDAPPIFLSRLRNAVVASDAVVSCLYHSPLSMHVAALARDVGKPFVYFSDGVEDWANMVGNPYLKHLGLKQHHPAYADAYFLCCKGGADYISMLGKETFVYSPRRVFSGGAATEMESRAMPENFRFLISTANTAYFDDAEFERLVTLLRQVKAILADKGLSCKYRILDKRLLDAIGVCDADNLESGTFEACLAQFDGLITTPSSIVIPAIKNNIPVALLDYRDVPMLLQTGWRLHGSCDIAGALERMMIGDRERISYQQTVLAGSVARDEVPGVLAGLIERNEAKTITELAAAKPVLGSRVGINFEYLARRLYMRIKRNGLVRQIARAVKSPK